MGKNDNYFERIYTSFGVKSERISVSQLEGSGILPWINLVSTKNVSLSLSFEVTIQCFSEALTFDQHNRPISK